MPIDTKIQFENDTRNHTIRIMLDSGLYRHATFRGRCRTYWFDLITWPGCLTIWGDMGTWTFARVEDMFTFFRGKSINPSYWAEKLQLGQHGGSEAAKVFDDDTFRAHILAQLKDHDDDAAMVADMTSQLEMEMGRLSGPDLQQAAYEFEYGNFRFDPCDMPSGMVYSSHFLWCLHAIVWGIQQWDQAAKAKARTG